MSGKIMRFVVPRFFFLQRDEKLLEYSIYIFEINSSWLEVKNSSRHQRIDLYLLYPLYNPSLDKEEY